MPNKRVIQKKPHFRIGKNVNSEGDFLESDIDKMQPSDADLQKGRAKRRIESLREKKDVMEDLLEVWFKN